MKLKKNICASIVISAIAFNSIVPLSYANENNEYQTYQKSIPRIYQSYNYAPEEVQQDLEELSSINYFKLKTDSNYEVALAHANGSYTFVEGTDTLDNAVNIANSLENEYVSQNIIPTVINSDGMVAYTTNSIGRIVKIGEGISQDSMNYTTNVYPNANKSDAHTYINHGFIDDVPVIEETADMVKVEISGYTGWIEKADKDGVNIVLLPINQAKNLSYYETVNGQLNHYISSNVEGNNGSKRSIGKAPSFMVSGKRYYSYDGNYFYTDIENLISDAKSNNHNNAVNSNNPYYNYYQYLSGRSKSSYSADDINKYFESKTPVDSVLKGAGKYFIKAQNKYGVNASYMIGIAMNESARGTSKLAKEKNNIFGLNAKDSSPQDAKKFESIEVCIDEFARDWMSNGYLNPKSYKYYGSNVGNKNLGNNVKYASDPFWGEKAASFMNEMDVYLSSLGINDDYNRYRLGVFNTSTSVNDKNGKNLYNASKGHVTIISDNRGSNIEINPDRVIPSSVTNPIPGSHDFTVKGYVGQGSINTINQAESNLIIDEIKGSNRYETAGLIADHQNYNTAILVNADNTVADGLSASGLAGATNAPILLTKTDSIPNDTMSRLKGVNKVYIIGSTSAVSKAVEDKLKSDSIQVVRLGGIDRLKTSYEVANEIKKIKNIDKVFLVNGYKGEADAMSVSSVASRDGVPIILTNGKDLTYNTNNVQNYVIGSTSVMDQSIVNKTKATRLGGLDRYSTNQAVVEKFYKGTNEFYISKGDILVDALTVSPLAKNYPVILAKKGSDKSAVKNATKLIQLGGMDNEVIDECINIIK
ncbi:cell wall-binding repeat-containing protein [Clostridium sp. CCUG 7971]|uniref:cell wall-binding repeat-containing protein n=1 Tax=Clostridium sp. CCUG 7971 TaxID=2811414 RepID=UPI001ABBABB5|nr:cell wall-binding repeat-containing protein [Clostridium sp. CCUG 7971]MBO3446272.1 cell wall-binding repeat-containing protein [Clostridium sp. CCUG 7971]